MSGLTGYLTSDGADLSYVFHPKNTFPIPSGNAIYSGTNTFSGTTLFSQLQLSYGTIAANITLASPILNFYHVTSATTTITLPSTVSSLPGTSIMLKHTNTGNITISCGASVIVGPSGTGSVTSITLTNARNVGITNNGGAWYIYLYTQ